MRDDGAVTRSTMIKAQDDADREEILARYTLPPDGEWVQSPLSITDPSTGKSVEKFVPAYLTKRVVPRTDFPASDFKRHTESRDKAAVNQFQVKVKDLWLVKWFTYEEQFKDVIDREHLPEIMNQILEHALSQFRQQLSQGISDSLLLSALQRF